MSVVPAGKEIMYLRAIQPYGLCPQLLLCHKGGQIVISF